MKIGIAGAGSIGTVFGASLARAHDVRVLVRDEAQAHAIARRGGLVVDAEAPVPVAVTHDARALAESELVIVAVKTFATVDALAPLRGILRSDTIVLSVQNGIDAAAQIREALGEHARVAAGPTTEAARLVEPGVVLRTSAGETAIGWVPEAPRSPGVNGTLLHEIAASFSACGLAAHAVDRVEDYLWAKLAINAAINPVTALARVPNGALLERPELFARGIAIAREVAALAARSGVTLPFTDIAERVRAVARATAANRSSMLQDVERGRPTEIEAILGTVVRRAAAFDLNVSASRAAYDEVRCLANA